MVLKLNKKNNIKLKLKKNLTSIWNLLILENASLLWENFTRNEVEKRFTLTLVKYDSGLPLQIEIVKVLSKNGENLIIERAVEPTPLNYNASENSQVAYDFDIWDFAFMNLTAWEINDICDEINKKLDKNDSLVTEFNGANNLVKLWADWKLPALDGSNLRNIQTETKNLNLNFVSGENIEAGSFVFVASSSKMKKIIFDDDLWNIGTNVTSWQIRFQKHPWKFKKLKIKSNIYWTWYLTLTKDAWGSQVFLKILLKSDKNEYSSADFTNYDENYDLTWKTLYIRSDWYQTNPKTKNEITATNNPFFYLETEKDVEVWKIYNADCFTKWKIFYLKDAVNKGQTAKVLTFWFVENLNLPLDKKDIFLNGTWKVTQVETDLKIWEKITNSIMELKNSEEKLPLIFHNLTLEAYNYSSSTTQTITIQHNLWFIKDFQVLVYNKAQKQFYGMWKNLVSGGSEIDCKISENLFNSLKIEIRRKLVPELELRFLLL